MYLKVLVAVLFLVSSALAGGIPVPLCPPNEVYKTCGGCEPGCTKTDTACAAVCLKGCFCIEKYVRYKGNCIPRDQCPKPEQCKDGEVYLDCGRCEGDCKITNPVCTRECKPAGCYCKDGYVRDNGQCIPVKKCPPRCKDGEVYLDCGKCEADCKNTNPVCTKECKPAGCYCMDGCVRDNGKCIPAKECPPRCESGEVYLKCGRCEGDCKITNPNCNKKCKPAGCYCKDGYVRDNGKCIPAKECPPRCESGEVYLKCGRCEGDCKTTNPTCTLECKPAGCYCKDGYVRDNGKCIPAKECPPRCESGEVYLKCGRCEGDCKTTNPTCTLECKPAGCYCKDGYVRDNGKCIPAKECPPRCESGEVYLKCGRCEGDCKTTNPICTLECKPAGCYCQDGYVRDNGKCIPAKECPPRCESGEVYLKCGRCEGDCKITNPDCNKECKPAGCYCQDGYVRDNGKCIPAKECPPRCESGEVYLKCGRCEGDCKTTNPICTLECKPAGCYCKDGYVRDNGKCIPAKECPPRCESGEVYLKCGRCEGDCKTTNPICTLECKPAGCYCKDGYVRDNGKCIPAKECPPRCKDGEVYLDCGKCEGDCKNTNPVCTKECKPAGCYCMDGCVRDNGKCIPVKKCPPRCESGEIWKECGCDATCKNTKPICPLVCEPKCYCIDNCVRDDNKRCIPRDKCQIYG